MVTAEKVITQKVRGDEAARLQGLSPADQIFSQGQRMQDRATRKALGGSVLDPQVTLREPQKSS